MSSQKGLSMVLTIIVVIVVLLVAALLVLAAFGFNLQKFQETIAAFLGGTKQPAQCDLNSKQEDCVAKLGQCRWCPSSGGSGVCKSVIETC